MIAPDRAVGKKKIPPLSLFRAFWKRKVLAGVVFVLAAAIGLGIVYALPAIYRSETLILVESQRIPEEFVKATVETNLQDRLSNLSQQILSYERLRGVVKKFGLYKEELATRPEEEVIGRMRSDISLTPEKGWSKDRPGAFRIAYEGKDPKLVERVASELASLFLEKNLETREVQAIGTSDFLNNQLTEAAKRLEDQEALLGTYKQRFSGELPQQENALIAEMSRMQVQLQGIQDGINRAQQAKVMTESALVSAQESASSLEEFAGKISASAEIPVPEGPRGSMAAASSVMIQRELDSLLLQYKPSHPAVRLAQALLAKAQEREKLAAATAAEAPTPASAPPAKDIGKSFTLSQTVLREKQRVKGLQAQLEAIGRQIDALEKDQKTLLKQIEGVQARVARLPIREQELAKVTRDHEISKASYQSLLDKKLSAQMATDMERNQKSERFVVLDAARVPTVPVRPNRPLFGGLSILAALLLGPGLALGMELRRGRVLGEWEMPGDIPILGRVPILPEDAPEGGKSRSRKLRLVATACLLMLMAAGAVGAGLYFRWFPV